jgi:hypothetical protein
MKRYLLAGLLAGAAPSLAHAEAALPAIGWSVSPGHSSNGSKICTFFGGFGEHSDLAWVAGAASPPQHFTLVFDDGGTPPRSQILVSQLKVATPGSPLMSIPGTVKFGQFRTSLDGRTLGSFLHLFVVKHSMTMALEGQSPVLVNLTGSADAAKDMRRCETVQNIPQMPKAPVRVAAATKRHARRRAHLVARAAPTLVVATVLPLPVSAPAAPVLPAPAVPTPVVATTTPLPAPTPAAPASPAPAALTLPVAAETPAPAAPAAQLALNDTILLAKAIEGQFLAILEDGKASYENTSDEALSHGARANRAADLCTLLGDDKEVIAWTGSISHLSSSRQRGDVLAVRLADGITVGTTDSGSSDGKDKSMIDPASDLFKTVSQMHVGERVTFSGSFFASDPDCIKENNPTQDGSMTAPNFLFKFTAIAAQQGPG